MTLAEREEEARLERRIDRQGLLLAAAFMLAYALVNATTLLMDARRRGAAMPAIQPFLEEFSSTIVLVALFPLLAIFVRRVPISSEGWPRALALHVLASIVFSALHVAGMALLRSVLTPEPGLGIPETHLGAAYPNPLNMPSGCRFHPRCPKRFAPCDSVAPKPLGDSGTFVECHLYDPQLAQAAA